MYKCTAIVVCTWVSAETGGHMDACRDRRKAMGACLVGCFSTYSVHSFTHSFTHLFERNLPLNLELTDEDK